MTQMQPIQPPAPTNSNLPVGAIVNFVGNTANIPSGWVLCNGQSVPSGFQYSGPKVPNLAGRAVIGEGTSPASGTHYTVGQTGGEEQHQLTVPELANHEHFSDNQNTQGDQGTNIFILGHASKSDAKGYSVFIPDSQGLQGAGSLWGDVGSTDRTDTTGNDRPHNNMQPYHVLYFIMYIGLPTANGLITNP